jgi:hypothetical protein
MDAGLVLSRWLRLVWASCMTGIAGSLLIGAWQLSKTAKKNSWKNVVFKGEIENGIISGEIVWKNKIYNLNWPGTVVPTFVQVRDVDGQPLEIRAGQLTKKDEIQIIRKMLIMAVLISLLTWFIAGYTFKHRFLIKI